MLLTVESIAGDMRGRQPCCDAASCEYRSEYLREALCRQNGLRRVFLCPDLR